MNNEINYDDFIIRTYRKGDYEGISHLWEVTDMGGCLLVMEKNQQVLYVGHHG
ncbi:MAG: hypothetical protein MUO72_13850 [Bacteroidales bacterium]|nr:hypothetical protein [Bacteroidales bacterium]